MKNKQIYKGGIKKEKEKLSTERGLDFLIKIFIIVSEKKVKQKHIKNILKTY